MLNYSIPLDVLQEAVAALRVAQGVECDRAAEEDRSIDGRYVQAALALSRYIVAPRRLP